MQESEGKQTSAVPERKRKEDVQGGSDKMKRSISDQSEPKPRLEDPQTELKYFGKCRKDYLIWEDYFMALTILTQHMNKVQNNKDGAAIFNEEKKLIGIGYTSTSMFDGDGGDSGNRNREGENVDDETCHAVINAVLNKNTADLKNCTLYVYTFPCNECAKVIIQAGIKRVFYYTREKKPDETDDASTRKDKKYEKYLAAEKMLDDAKVSWKPFNTKLKEIRIDFRGKTPEDQDNDNKSPQKSQTPQTSEDKKMEDPVSSKTASKKDIEENDYFMAIAFLAKERSKDPVTQVGACIVSTKKKVVGIGYNGMPVGFDDNYTHWGKDDDNYLESKRPFVCHAEFNAVLFRNVVDVQGSTIYVTLFPCYECAKIIINSEIEKVVYYSDKKHTNPDTEKSRKLLLNKSVKLEQFTPVDEEIQIKLDPRRSI